ncbi:MAG: hypothetical protein MUP04_11075 [Anaerolineae bacterium]|nr:hypothetical protein [Anaerolineae bacterium]
MIGQGKVVGIILAFVGLALGAAWAVWLAITIAACDLQPGGAACGVGFLLVIVLPFLAAGGYLLIRGREEAREFAEVEKEKRVLNMVQTQGRTRVSDVALELNVSRDQVKGYIYDLVGKGLFTGYIDWKEGVLYAKEAAEMETNKCPNCGATREFVGKGIVKCEYCGAELFL